MRSLLKALPLAALGCAAALLVACGNSNGLLSGSQASSLQDALAAVQSACERGDAGHAAIAVQSFADRVNALPAGQVDRRLIGNLQDGAATLETLVARTCTRTAATTTTTTPTTATSTTPTTTTSTTPTTTVPTTTTTTPTTPTTPPTTTTTPGGTTPPGNSGGAPGVSGGAPPGQLKKQGNEDG
ncbi:MAG: hypothetical protein JSS99_04555 [Actinobacteria bacterium]|nr:hypothetical protein [Actinomycetota bacterium]